ncbi:MAG: glycosyltransferase family 4 protein, partial [Chloroflexota bacterium]|nr:glycosyltransferase family 4 protein [Chloroflexota bacterium]
RRVDEVLKYLSRDGVSVKYLQARNVPAAVPPRNLFLRNLWYMRRLRKLAGGGNLILLEDYSQRTELCLFNVAARLTAKAKLVSLANGFYFSYRTSLIKNWIDWLISFVFFLPSHLVITSGKAAAREVVGMGVPPGKIRVIYPALRAEFVQNTIPRQGKGIGYPVNLLFVGRLHPVKGLEYLLEALQRLKDQDIRLTLVVSSQDLEHYGGHIAGKIARLGIGGKIDSLGEVQEAKKLLEIYRAADIFVAPSLWDTSPASVLEAMCVGLPVVATRVGGIPEFVEDGVNGILVPPKDPQALAHAILALVKDSELREKMGRRSLEKSHVFRHRSWDDVGKEYHEAISQLLQR